MSEKIDYTNNYRRTIFSWSLYDFANQPYPTIIITFVYSSFFTHDLAKNYQNADSLWLFAISICAIIIALLSPIMGAIADRSGYRKTYLIACTWICVISTLFLYFPQPGQIWFALILVVISNAAFEMGQVFCNSYLPDIAPKNKIGRISGYGWSFGYIGGLIGLAICLVVFYFPEKPFNPFTGNLLNKENYEHIRSMPLFISMWFAFFSLPTFIFLKDRKREKLSVESIRKSYNNLLSTFKEIKQYNNILKFLIARMLYNDAILTIFSFGGIYAREKYGWDIEMVLIFGIGLNVAAGSGAFLFGFLDDYLGPKRTIQISNYAIFIAVVIAVLSKSEELFWLAGIILGIASGPNQSASRSLMGRIVPENKVNEFYGFYAFSGKATSFAGFLILSVVILVTGSQEIGMMVVSLLLIAGIYLLGDVEDNPKIN
ncbi:MFS transporter [Candidatus Marinimicrobia bacterium]|nr:MFS transporter [Candidatus Neomarinimicrobiota bacterium]